MAKQATVQKPVVKKPVPGGQQRPVDVKGTTAMPKGLAGPASTDIPEFLERDPKTNKRTKPNATPPKSDPAVSLDSKRAQVIVEEHAVHNRPARRVSTDRTIAPPPAPGTSPEEQQEKTATEPFTVFGSVAPVNPPKGTVWMDENTNPTTPRRWNGKEWVLARDVQVPAPRAIPPDDRSDKEKAAPRTKAAKGEGLTSKIGPIAEELLSKAWTTKAQLVAAMVERIGCEEYAASNVAGVWLSNQNRSNAVEKKPAAEGQRGMVYAMAKRKFK